MVTTRDGRRAARRIWMTAMLLASFGLACSEASPAGDELAAPAERDAAPVGEAGLERTEQERREERLEEWNVAEPDADAADAR